VQEENTVKFKIRYTLGINDGMKIRFQGRIYDITAIDNAEYKKRFLEIRARVVEADGEA
jgi:SPP1 family predicted phage head-tail adaptor